MRDEGATQQPTRAGAPVPLEIVEVLVYFKSFLSLNIATTLFRCLLLVFVSDVVVNDYSTSRVSSCLVFVFFLLKIQN